MPTLISPRCFGPMVLLVAVVAQCQDLRIRAKIVVDGTQVSVTETSIRGPRQRIETQSPGGTSTVIRQCDLKRTVTLHEDTQTFSVVADPKEQTSATSAESGAYVIETAAVTDTGQTRQMYDLPARHLQTTVTVHSSKGACTQVDQKYEVDGWYVDLPEGQAACHPFLPAVQLASGCSDTIVRRRSGSANMGFPLKEWITLHNTDGSTTLVVVKPTNVHKNALEPELFEVPPAYQESK